MIAAALALALAAGPGVTVELLAKQAPRSLVVRGGGAVRSVAARGDTLVVDGRAVPRLALPAGRWRVELPGVPPRTYRGAFALWAEGGVVRVRAELDLEPYVAGVVASEALPGTPPAALEALAIAVRSYALATRDRHPGGALCDLAHCQLLRAAGIAAPLRAAAARAARATAGVVLVLPSGEVAAAAFHASCGGHTAEPREAFGSAASGGGARADAGCAGPEWEAELTPGALAAAVRAALTGDRGGAAVPPALHGKDLVLLRGAGGWIARVEARDGAWALSGDAFARALDAAVGRGRIRSTRLALADVGGRVVVHGSGHGHGVGLCQAGAARWAEQGEDRRAILARYFPGALVRAMPMTAPLARDRRGRGRSSSADAMWTCGIREDGTLAVTEQPRCRCERESRSPRSWSSPAASSPPRARSRCGPRDPGVRSWRPRGCGEAAHDGRPRDPVPPGGRRRAGGRRSRAPALFAHVASRTHAASRALQASRSPTMKEAHVDLWQRYAVGAAIAVTTNGTLAPDGRPHIGRGTARQASERFPWFDARLGEALAARGNHVALLGERIASFPVEHSPFDIPDLELIVRSARELVVLCDAQGWAEVVLPRPGCGGGGLDWSEVSPLLAPVLDDRFQVVTWDRRRGSRA